MKKIALLFSIVIFATSFCFASVNNYKIDDKKIDVLFSNATELISLDRFDVAMPAKQFHLNLSENEDSHTLAVAFCLSFTLGWLGVHRLYLGTSTGTFFIYLCTLGGCVILNVVDIVGLMIAVLNRKDASKYINNPDLYMWN